MFIRLKTQLALGNGTREAGFLLATVDCAPDDIGALTEESLRCATLEQLAAATGATITLPEEVRDIELLTALRNPRKVSFVSPGDEASEDDSEKGDGDSWGDAAVANVLPPELAEPLVAAGLETVGQVVDFGSENKGLTSIKGIGEATEKKIAEALASVANPAS